jgi:hypothetical protein
MLPLTVMGFASAMAARRVIALIGPRLLLAISGLITAGGMAWLSRLPVHSSYLLHVFAPTLVLGVGLSLMLLPVVVSATVDLPARDAGLASGLVNVARQLGGGIGLAILVTVAASISRSSGLHSHNAAVVHGYRMALLIDAGVSLLAATAALFLPRATTSPQPEQQPVMARPHQTTTVVDLRSQ